MNIDKEVNQDLVSSLEEALKKARQGDYVSMAAIFIRKKDLSESEFFVMKGINLMWLVGSLTKFCYEICMERIR